MRNWALAIPSTSGYRISSLIPGSLSLILADNMAWSVVFWITAALWRWGLAVIDSGGAGPGAASGQQPEGRSF